MKKVILPIVLLTFVLGVYGQEISNIPMTRKFMKLDPNLVVPTKVSSKDTASLGWWEVCFGAYENVNGGTSANGFNNVLWPDTLVGSTGSSGFSYVWNAGIGFTFDPYTISYDPNLTLPIIQQGNSYVLDSFSMPTFYYRSNTMTDTLIFDIVHGLPAEDPVFNKVWFTNTTDTTSPPYFTQIGSQYKGAAMRLTAPNRIVKKYLLTDADSTMGNGKFIDVKVGAVIPAGHIVGIMVQYAPGNTNYNLGDTVFDYTSRAALNGNNAFLIIGNSETNPLFFDPFGWSLMQLIFPEQRYGFMTPTFLNECMAPDRTWGVSFWAQVDEITGINEYGNEENIKLYPNPSNDVIFVELENNRKSEFVIYDILGKVEKTGQFVNSKNQINISDLSKGMYIIQINDNNKTRSFKFSVK
ncbi:T9SS type A sorting domain-containing protein [candidate division KSB1 bacterium]